VEVSLQVDRHNVERAARRAATLSAGGMETVPLVVGRGWASAEPELLAEERRVQWRVAEEGSAGYSEFRRGRV